MTKEHVELEILQKVEVEATDAADFLCGVSTQTLEQIEDMLILNGQDEWIFTDENPLYQKMLDEYEYFKKHNKRIDE
jgi:hypothetical protein